LNGRSRNDRQRFHCIRITKCQNFNSLNTSAKKVYKQIRNVVHYSSFYQRKLLKQGLLLHFRKLFQTSNRLWLNNTKTGKNDPLLNADFIKKVLHEYQFLITDGSDVAVNNYSPATILRFLINSTQWCPPWNSTG
jgi:hypothetical protein